MATLLALTESNRYYSNHACHTQLVSKVTYKTKGAMQTMFATLSQALA